MNISERIIALDEKLDEVILARGQRLAEELEFAYEPDDQRKGGVGGVLGGAGLAGAAYAGSAAYRGRKSGAGMKKTMSGDMAKVRSSFDGVGKGGMKGMKNRFKQSKGVMRGAGNAVKPGMGTKAAGKLKKLRKMIKFGGKKGFGYEEENLNPIEFGMFPIPAKVFENASPSKKAKIMALLKSRRAKIIGGGAAAAMGGFAAGRASKKK